MARIILAIYTFQLKTKQNKNVEQAVTDVV